MDNALENIDDLFKEVDAMSKSSYNGKIVIVGDCSVGKTALVERFIDDRFTRNYNPTVGFSNLHKRFVVSSYDVSLHIWDISGNEMKSENFPNYFSDTDGVILAYDVTINESLDHVLDWYTNIISLFGGSKMPRFFVVGCKNDLMAKLEDTSIMKIKNLKLDHHFCSAKSGFNVDVIFAYLSATFVNVNIKNFEIDSHIKTIPVNVDVDKVDNKDPQDDYDGLTTSRNKCCIQ